MYKKQPMPVFAPLVFASKRLGSRSTPNPRWWRCLAKLFLQMTRLALTNGVLSINKSEMLLGMVFEWLLWHVVFEWHNEIRFSWYEWPLLRTCIWFFAMKIWKGYETPKRIKHGWGKTCKNMFNHVSPLHVCSRKANPCKHWLCHVMSNWGKSVPLMWGYPT